MAGSGSRFEAGIAGGKAGWGAREGRGRSGGGGGSLGWGRGGR